MLALAACATPPEGHARADTGAVIDTPAAAVQADAPTPTNPLETGGTVPIDKEQSNFEFEGFGVGKSHVGTFEEMDGTVTYADGRIVAAQGVIQAASVKSDSGGLDKHLRNEDFFHVEQYPEIRFSSNEITDEAMIGELTFLGVTREITIPLMESGERLIADFLLDTEQFGMSYTGVNKDVRIAFVVMG